jgi:hypothetical protein
MVIHLDFQKWMFLSSLKALMAGDMKIVTADGEIREVYLLNYSLQVLNWDGNRTGIRKLETNY